MPDDLREICNRLGIDEEKLRNTAVLVLPENFDSAKSRDDLYDANGSILLAKGFKASGVSCKTGFDLGLKPKVLDRRGADVWLGLVWFLENGLAPTAVGVLSSWLTVKYLSGDSEPDDDDETTIHVELRVQRKDRVSTFKIDGPPSHVVAVVSALKELTVSKNE